VAIVIPAAKEKDGEMDAALETADRVAGMLDELGLGSDAVDDQEQVDDLLASLGF